MKSDLNALLCVRKVPLWLKILPRIERNKALKTTTIYLYHCDVIEVVKPLTKSHRFDLIYNGSWSRNWYQPKWIGFRIWHT